MPYGDIAAYVHSSNFATAKQTPGKVILSDSDATFGKKAEQSTQLLTPGRHMILSPCICYPKAGSEIFTIIIRLGM